MRKRWQILKKSIFKIVKINFPTNMSCMNQNSNEKKYLIESEKIERIPKI